MNDEQFCNAIYYYCPLRFDAWSFLDFYKYNKNLGTDMEQLVHELRICFWDKFVLPEDKNLSLAVYYFQQRYYKESVIPHGPYAIEDDSGESVEKGKWSHFYLLYLHLYRYVFPPHFCYQEPFCQEVLDIWNRLTADGIHHKAAMQIRRELLGYRWNQPVSSRHVPIEELQKLSEQAAEKFWLPSLNDSSIRNRPDVILALSFKGNGFSRMMMSPTCRNLWESNTEFDSYLVEKCRLYLSCDISFSLNDDESRAVMFLLQLWFLLHPEKADYTSREHLVFCLLYLHLYREPLSQYFTRSTFAKRWHEISFDKKEAVAASMRRHLTQIRNEAARMYPCVQV